MSSGARGAAVGAIVGGWGAQVLTGTAEDDVLHGDPPPGSGLPRLAARAEARGGDGALAGPARSVGVAAEGGPWFYAAGAESGSGGATGWSVGAEGDLRPVWSQLALRYDAGDMRTGAPAIAAAEWAGATYLVTAGVGASLARLDPGGVPEPLEAFDWDWGTGVLYPGALEAWTGGGALRILAAGGWAGGLTVLRWSPLGLELESRTEAAPGLSAGDAADLAVIRAGETDFALAVSRADGALTVWELALGEPPTLRDRREAGDGETRFDLAGARAVEAAVIDGDTFVWAAAPGGALITYRLSVAGRLDRLAAQAGVQDLAFVELGDRRFLFAVDGGAVVSVFEVAEGGRLDPVEALDLAPGARASAVSAVADGARVLLMVARAEADGHDLLTFQPAGDDRIDAGAGDDRVHGGGGADMLLGGAGDDRLEGEAGADRLDGGEGADVLHGGGDEDRLFGGAANDVLHGGDGDDLLRGGAGNDVLIGADAPDVLEGRIGADLIRGGAGADRLLGQAGNDLLIGGGRGDVLKGHGGADELRGGGGHDRLAGGGGPDRLEGGGGRDLLKGKRGADALDGGGGRDVLKGGGGDDVLSGGRGKDRLLGQGGNDSLDGGGGRDRLKGQAGDDSLLGSGGRDVLKGNRGDDALAGGAGPDRLSGGGGADRLSGGEGRDRLIGGGGADELRGGAGGDRLRGGPGEDVFRFGESGGRDRLLDWEAGDRMAFDGAADFDALTLIARPAGALVRHGEASVLVQGVDPEALGPEDFLFA